MSPSTQSRENREFASELKFRVAPDVAREIELWARTRLTPDPHACGEQGGNYRISSLYFDTPRFDVFHRNGSYGRSKYRIRRYGPSDIAFLERKLKTRGLVSKRRSAVNLEELRFLDNEGHVNGWPGKWYQQRIRIRQLRPVCEIAYFRTALVSATNDGPVRLTLDTQIEASPANGLFFSRSKHSISLSVEHFILELKFLRETPALFKEVIERFGLFPQAYSKYRTAVSVLGLVPASTDTLPGECGLKGVPCLNS